MKKLALILITLLFLVSCKNSANQNFDILIKNASIIDVKKGTVSSEKFIGITQDTIAHVGNMDEIKNFSSKRTVDVQNNFVMPSLWDMHVHFRGGDELITENKNLLPLFLAFGVTTVRDAGGDMTKSILQWQKEIKSKKLIGPTIFTSGPKLDGTKPAWPGSLKIENTADITKAIDSLEVLGADYVKIYDGNLTKEMFYGIIKEAEKREIKSTGHMPLSANILEAANLGLDGTEHTYYALKSASPLNDSLTKLNIGYGMFGEIFDTYSPNLAKQVFKQLATKEFYITPTQGIVNILSDVATKDHSKDSLLPYIGDGIIKTYQRRVLGAKRAAKSGRRSIYSDILTLAKDYIPAMNKEGILLLAGSDCGAFNSYSYPGESLIDELTLLVKAGLTPQEALVTSVVNGPHFFDLDDYYGTLEKGKVADILILEQNPLENIDNIKSMKTLVVKGDVYEKKDIQLLLESIKKK